jgi:NAD(P)-dependent dehydrogenase (short-subunit alcohol dehydrogenase family)
MSGICDGRVAIVTGAGRGIGRAHALEFARQGAKVVVNDLGAELDGQGGSTGPAGEVVDEIRAMGSEAVANGDDVADWEGARRLVQSAIDAFGRLDTLINNAGILRDRMLVNMSEDDWDSVMRVHLKGHFCPTRHAAAYWREQTKAGERVQARVVLTSSGAGLYGNVGQANYSAAKSGIATLARVAGALRRDRERDRPRGAHPHDRGTLRRHDGQTRARLRLDGAREHRPARGLAGERGLG